MELHYTTSIFSAAQSGDGMLMITIPKTEKSLYDNIRAFEDDKPKVMSIDYYKEKRSLSANGYLFALIEKIAKKIGTNKNDLYVSMITDYGVKYENMYMTYEAFLSFDKMYSKSATTVKHNSSLCRIINKYTKGTKEWVEFEVYMGSSGYDKKQFSDLLDGVISDAKLQDIETMTPQEIQSLIDKMEGL